MPSNRYDNGPNGAESRRIPSVHSINVESGSPVLGFQAPNSGTGIRFFLALCQVCASVQLRESEKANGISV